MWRLSLKKADRLSIICRNRPFTMNSNSTSRRFTVIAEYRSVINKRLCLTFISKVFYEEQAMINGRFQLILINTSLII